MTRERHHCYLALWAATATGAALALAGLDLVAGSVPHDALPATLATAGNLLTHNAAVALWPLALVALGWPAIPGARQLGDALVAGQLAGHGALVGSALAQHPGLWRYLPHLPLEWLALAIPAAAWLTARAGTEQPHGALARIAAIAAGLLALAAVVETYAVPLP